MRRGNRESQSEKKGERETRRVLRGELGQREEWNLEGDQGDGSSSRREEKEQELLRIEGEQRPF